MVVLVTSTGTPRMPNFRSSQFLIDHISHTMSFYHPRSIDLAGGFYHFFRDDGSVYNRTTRHLVSSTRYVFTYAMAYRQFGGNEFLNGVRHGLQFLETAHHNPETGGYAWMLEGKDVKDGTNHCYGLAFVLLAYAKAVEANIDGARAKLESTWDLLERRFWDPDYGLYKDEASASWELSSYRGQNANMHACEAMLAAFEATAEAKYLNRAETIADNIVNRQASLTDGLVWEHFHDDWSVDELYNFGDHSNDFRPWGFQPGHQTEWAKLLLILDRHRPDPWHLKRARELFDTAIELSWDPVHEGMVYGIGTDRTYYNDDKYFWVQAESIAAAALLASRTNDNKYWQWYDRLWAYCWDHFVDHQYGAWFKILSRDNKKLNDEKSPAGKVDYHTMGACYDVLRAIGHAAR
jgi:mannose/cellobiose epimerase-like protein (N-acyl-D-glucosamine 2-epimerase family)